MKPDQVWVIDRLEPKNGPGEYDDQPMVWRYQRLNRSMTLEVVLATIAEWAGPSYPLAKYRARNLETKQIVIP